MVVRLRLARFGRIHDPHYRIVAIDVRRRRDGRAIEYLGSYHPKPDKFGVKNVQFDPDRVKYWLAVGAQPSERVAKLLSLAGILPPIVHNKITTRLQEVDSATAKTIISGQYVRPALSLDGFKTAAASGAAADKKAS